MSGVTTKLTGLICVSAQYFQPMQRNVLLMMSDDKNKQIFVNRETSCMVMHVIMHHCAHNIWVFGGMVGR